MSKYLSLLLNAHEPAFGRLIRSLEDASASTGVDVRLTAEIRQGLAEKIAALGLDPKDTTAEELYAALQLRAAQDSMLLAEHFGIKPKDTSVSIIEKIGGFFSKSSLTPEVWSLKRTALKKLLSENIPHKTMKALHYRSVASMLKRESPACVYAVAMLIEGQRYKQRLLSSIKEISSSQFEVNKIEFVRFSVKQWKDIEKQVKQPVVPVFGLPEANALVIIPTATERSEGLALLVSALLLHEVRRLKEHASYFKFRSLDRSLHEHVQTVAREGRVHMLSVQGQPVYWHHFHRVFAKQPDGRSYLEPHVNREDLDWTALEASLAGLHEQLGFWIGTHLLGFVSEKHVVSLHIIDVTLNLLYKKTIEEGGRRFVQDMIWDELLVRYLEVPPFSQLLERHMYKLADNVDDLLYDEA